MNNAMLAESVMGPITSRVAIRRSKAGGRILQTARAGWPRDESGACSQPAIGGESRARAFAAQLYRGKSVIWKSMREPYQRLGYDSDRIELTDRETQSQAGAQNRRIGSGGGTRTPDPRIMIPVL